MTHPYESWQNERQGPARHSRGNRTIRDVFRNEYHAPSKSDQTDVGIPFSEQDLIDYHEWLLTQRQSEALDYPN